MLLALRRMYYNILLFGRSQVGSLRNIPHSIQDPDASLGRHCV